MSPSDCQTTFRVRPLDQRAGRPRWRRRYLQREALPSFASALREVRAYHELEFLPGVSAWYRITERRETPGRRCVCYSRDVLLFSGGLFEDGHDVVLNRKRERECSNVG